MPYPTPPGPRLAYDHHDLAEVFVHRSRDYGGGYLELPMSIKQYMNMDHGGGLVVGAGAHENPSEATYAGATLNIWEETQTRVAVTSPDAPKISIIFRHPVDIMGMMVLVQRFRSGSGSVFDYACDVRVEASTNATNPVDGDWEELAIIPRPFTGNMGYPELAPGQFHTAQGRSLALIGGAVTDGGGFTYNRLTPLWDNFEWMTALSKYNVRGLRFSATTSVLSTSASGGQATIIHLYGAISASADDQQVAFWAPTQNIRLPADALSWGDVNIATSGDKTFRVRNLSETLTAEDISITSYYTVLGTTPDPKDQFTFSLDGTTWLNPLPIPNLSPRSISPLIHMRRVTPSDASLGYWAPRVRIDVEDWT